MLDEKLLNAIEEHDTKMVEILLKERANPNALSKTMLDKGYFYSALYGAIDEMTYGGEIEVVYLLLKYGAEVNLYSDDGNTTPLCVAINNNDSKLAQLLLNLGANPNIMDESHLLPLLGMIDDSNIKIATLLLEHGGISRINDIGYLLCGCTSLDRAAFNLDIPSLKLLLNNGADPSCLDEDGVIAQKYLPVKESLNSKKWEKAYNLLNAKNPPYLKLGTKEEDKYIIYENQDGKPYLLADIEEYKDKKYLYHGVEITLFIYWCYKNKLLVESVIKVVQLYEEEILPLSPEKLIEMMKGTIGTKVTTDYFTEEGKKFAIGYLTVTNWAYNLFYDLRRVYPTDTDFPKKLETEEELNTILKLLDIRYKQFNSGESFNANQNREELLKLLDISMTKSEK